MIQRQKVSKCCWKNGANRLAQHRAATNLPFVKNTVSAKQSTIHKYKYVIQYKVKHNKTKYACIDLGTISVLHVKGLDEITKAKCVEEKADHQRASPGKTRIQEASEEKGDFT